VRAHGDPTAALRAEWQRLVAELPGLRVHFVRELDPRDVTELQSMATNVQRLATLAAQLQEPLRLRCRGHNDEPGSATTNRGLRTRRAQWLCGQLREAGVAASLLREDEDTASNPPIIDARAASLEFDTAALEDE
jgi:hypothetical protein